MTKSPGRLTFGGRWRRWFGRADSEAGADTPSATGAGLSVIERFEMDQYDPLIAYLEQNSRAMLVDRIPIESPAVDMLRRDGIDVIVPLLTHGRLLGVLNLGPRLSGQGYTRDDLALLENLATQSAAAIRVAQLVQEQQEALRERERIAQQLRLARDIQKTLLPKSVPVLPGWRLSAYYQPAWEVGGDFYDFIHFPDGYLGIIIGDVTDKGMPSALVMASTRSLLRASAERDRSPGAVLANANRALYEDIPPQMFVTCFYLLLNPSTGHVRYANAGHDLPYRRRDGAVSELRATGMPLGLMPDMPYDEYETTIERGETIVFYSDGLVEAHNPSGDMFGTPRLLALFRPVDAEGPALIRTLLDGLAAFTGPGWRQEDDVTLVAISRSDDRTDMEHDRSPADHPEPDDNSELARFTVPSAPGNEILAIEQVVDAIRGLPVGRERLDRIKTAVGEAVMNGMEHGNRFREDLPVEVSVARTGERITIRVMDAGPGLPVEDRPDPDIEAKLAGRESPRGWGLFLMRSMADELQVFHTPSGQITELVFNLEHEHGHDTTV